MHISVLTTDMFDVRIDHRAASFGEVFPNFTELDRVGVVVRTPYGGLGASHLIVRAVVAHYERRTGLGEVYPDYYLFSVGGMTGDHSMMDIWPPHHYVDVPNDAQAIAESINDRGITRLLVESTTPSTPIIDNWTRQSALHRIETALVFDSAGVTDQADVTISATADVEREIGLQLDPDRVVRESEGFPDFLAYYATKRGEVSEERTRRLRAVRESSAASGKRSEAYRRVTVEESLSLLRTA